jgi:hypothetical protein
MTISSRLAVNDRSMNVTALAVLALFFLFRGGRVTGRRLSWASLLYLLFAGALALG